MPRATGAASPRAPLDPYPDQIDRPTKDTMTNATNQPEIAAEDLAAEDLAADGATGTAVTESASAVVLGGIAAGVLAALAARRRSRASKAGEPGDGLRRMT